jgi:hypothetical protein
VPVDLSLFERFTRRDLAHAGERERPTDEDYARYIRLALAYRDHGYDDAWAHDEAEFAVVDPVFNTVWAASERALAELAARLDLDPGPHLDSAARITTALQDRLWGRAASWLRRTTCAATRCSWRRPSAVPCRCCSRISLGRSWSGS